MGDADGFERVLDLVTDASRALLDKLKKQLPPQRQLRGS
jgi:hypothetical protein